MRSRSATGDRGPGTGDLHSSRASSRPNGVGVDSSTVVERMITSGGQTALTEHGQLPLKITRASAPAGMDATGPGRVITGRSDGSRDRRCDILASMSFSRAQDVALVREIDAASSLLRHGFAMLAEYRFALRDAEPVFDCLAGGAEKC
ncbi:MAG: hypothetical protein QOJ29_4443 [Thermoleophilaceae bacterium]|nr:hypothetical protein [Thermoleophilaceae bacterium]